MWHKKKNTDLQNLFRSVGAFKSNLPCFIDTMLLAETVSDASSTKSFPWIPIKHSILVQNLFASHRQEILPEVVQEI